MKIRNFQDEDIKTAINLSHLVWGNFYESENSKIQNLIYEFTVKYYDLNRNFSYSISSYEDVKGFLLAAEKRDKNKSINILEEMIKSIDDEEQTKILSDMYDFLQNCGYETKKLMNEDDIMLGLFVSTQKGGGKKLLSELVKDCRNRKFKNIYLWSDTTCDYDYYQKHNFETVKKIETVLNNKEITVFVYRKKVQNFD